jgi:hypothetical protein
MSETRKMRCPVCGYLCETEAIGAVYCGPHGQGAAITPAVQMVEADYHCQWCGQWHSSILGTPCPPRPAQKDSE